VYPKILSETETVNIALTRSLSRVGEGEFRLAAGTGIKSQRWDGGICRELRSLMSKPPADCLVCLPRIWYGMPAENFWRKFTEPPYSHFYNRDYVYGSAFVSRSDVVNEIDNPTYWGRFSDIWRGKDVILVSRSTKVLDLSLARSVFFTPCPPTDAYEKINEIEERIGLTSRTVLLAAGATATVLAARLSGKGVHAVDVGHLGRFMACAGAYTRDRRNLISDDYVTQNQVLHRRPEGYGGSGHKRRDEVLAFARELDAAVILDYGCGQGTLKTSLSAIGVTDILEYDPAVKGKNGLPKPAELVVCTDVLEHVEPDRLTAVLAHLFQLTLVGAFFLIAMRKANKILPDGRNAHLIIEDSRFWISRVERAGFKILRQRVSEGKEIRLWLTK